MEENYDFEGRTEQEVLLSLTANKGHRTRQAKKINNLLTLQDQKYSKTTEQTLLKIVSALERYQDRLSIFADWLNLHTLESAAAHVAKAANKPESDKPTIQCIRCAHGTRGTRLV